MTTCPHCNAEIASAAARFCVECGRELASTGMTVRLSNARVEQSVIGGTIKLASAGAIPPGMWVLDAPPGASDVVAVYAPLRAVVGGWSGLIDAGWQLIGQLPPLRGSTKPRFRFTTTREWFAAKGCGAELRLMVAVEAEAEADEGHTRRGFRYRSEYDPPMQVVESWWVDQRGARVEQPRPEIQIMAPPRIPRISDVREQFHKLPEPLAVGWAREGQIHEAFHLLQARQQRTPAGRGLPLGSVAGQNMIDRFLRRFERRYYARVLNPLRCTWPAWQELQPAIQQQAQELGLALETDATIEWWLDQQGHDGVLFDGVADRYAYRRVLIAFRRSQIVHVEGS